MPNPVDTALAKAERFEPLDDDDAYALLYLPTEELERLVATAFARRARAEGFDRDVA